MELNVKRKGSRVRFEIYGIIDEQGVEALTKRFYELDSATVKELVLDFGNVGYICSSGVCKVLMFYRELTSNGSKFHIENDTGIVHEVFTLARLNMVFSINKKTEGYHVFIPDME
jgi:anti-anti-sigma factor